MSERRQLEFEDAASPAEVADTLCRIADGICQRALSVSLGEDEITVYPDAASSASAAPPPPRR